MSKEEVMAKKSQYLTVEDIGEIFDISAPTAQQIMRRIKKFNDILGVKGKVTISDYERWYRNELVTEMNEVLE